MALGDFKMGETATWVKDRFKMSAGISVILASDPQTYRGVTCFRNGVCV